MLVYLYFGFGSLVSGGRSGSCSDVGEISATQHDVHGEFAASTTKTQKRDTWESRKDIYCIPR